IDKGKLSTSITVKVRADKIGEPDETFFVALSQPENATIADGQGVGTIVDDDGGGPAALPALSISDASGVEGDSGTSNLSFVVSLSAPAPAGGTTFTLTTADDTASEPSDYTSSTVAGSIAAGNTQYVFNVPIVGDISAEDDETFFVNVTNVVGATTLDGQAVGTIVDDDGGGGTTPLLSIAPVQHAEGNLGSTPFTFTVTLSPAATT